jgi:hypothetical protein
MVQNLTTISTQMWLEQEDDTLGMGGSFVEFRVMVDAINGYWIENESEICIVVQGDGLLCRKQRGAAALLSEYFNPMRL